MGRRLIIGVCALCGGVLFIWIFAIAYPFRFPAALGMALFAAAWALGGAIGWVGCNLFKPKRENGGLTDYDKSGLLVTEEFSARRAFEVEEFEDEGRHFFLELEDRRVLFLCGQYLYDHEEITDDPELNRPATFPCTRFQVRRHKAKRSVYSLECLGTYLKPDAVLPHYSKAYQKAVGYPTDGDIFTIPYDALFARIKEPASRDSRDDDPPVQ
jgi:hypothetical protein